MHSYELPRAKSHYAEKLLQGLDRAVQLEKDSEYHIYPHEGVSGNPHDHSREITVLRGGADSTDGIEMSSRPLGPGLPNGVMIEMNSTPRNFLVFRWQDVAAAVTPALRLNGAR